MDPHQIRNGDKLLPFTRSLDLQRDSLDVEARTVDVTFSTDADDLERWFGYEILDHSPESVRLGRLNNGAPFLMDHNPGDQRGAISKGSALVDGGRGKATVRFSRSERGQELLDEVNDGIREKISVGYHIHELTHEGQRNGIDVYRATDWEPLEVSSVAIEFDTQAGVDRAKQESLWAGRSASLSKSVRILNSKPEKPMSKENTEPSQADIEAAAEKRAAEITAERDAKRAAEKAAEEAAELAKREAEEAAEKRALEIANQREEIRSIGEGANMDEKEIRQALEDGISADAFKVRCFDAKKAANPPFDPATSESNRQESNAKAGTRAHTEETWGSSAIQILGSKARGIKQRTIGNIYGAPYKPEQSPELVRALTGAPTLASVTAANLDDTGADIINESADQAPELFATPVSIIPGELVNLSVVSDSVAVGFRDPNEGTASVAGAVINRPFATSVIEAIITADLIGVVGAADDAGRFLRGQAAAVTRGVLKSVGTQSWYGASAQAQADAKASPGFVSQVTNTVPNGGVTAPTSVYVAAMQEGEADHVYSSMGSGPGFSYGEWRQELIDDDAGNPLDGLVNTLSARFAPRLGNVNRMVRISGVGTGDGETLTASLLFSAFEVLQGLGFTPNTVYMNPRSQYQLRDDLVTNSSAASAGYAEVPMSFSGAAIVSTPNLVNDETI